MVDIRVFDLQIEFLHLLSNISYNFVYLDTKKTPPARRDCIEVDSIDCRTLKIFFIRLSSSTTLRKVTGYSTPFRVSMTG
jgi:hypothetical protein